MKEHIKKKDIIIMSNQETRIHRLIAMCWVLLGPTDQVARSQIMKAEIVGFRNNLEENMKPPEENTC